MSLNCGRAVSRNIYVPDNFCLPLFIYKIIIIIFSLKMALTYLEKLAFVIVMVFGLRIVIRLSVFAWKKFIAPAMGCGIDVATQGRWAVVTGATDGLGKAFAEALAAKGLDIILVSRSLNKLENVAAEIKATYGVETKIVEADLTEGQPVYAKITKAIEELEIGVLVNNAGASYDHPEMFINITDETIAKILQINVAAVTGVIRAVLSGMMDRKKGIIINISSVTAAIPSPYLSVYAASKAFVVKLSDDLAAEAAPRGVTVQCVLPGPVVTKMSKIKKATWIAPTPEKYVEACLKTIGIESKTTGYPPHCLFIGLISGLRYFCEKGAVWLVAKSMLYVRGRVLKKKKRDAANSQHKEKIPVQ